MPAQVLCLTNTHSNTNRAYSLVNDTTGAFLYILGSWKQKTADSVVSEVSPLVQAASWSMSSLCVLNVSVSVGYQDSSRAMEGEIQDEDLKLYNASFCRVCACV